jgi:DNA-binding GntR family transcriptional regulator
MGSTLLREDGDKPATLTLQALKVIRTAILAGLFKPGDRITERELCDLTGVSRTAVREALRRLEVEGLITYTPNRGPIVSRITADGVRQMFQVRLALEGLAAQQFALRATGEELDALTGAYERIAATHETRDVDGFIAATDQFYEIILSGSGNEVIQTIVNSLRARLTYLRILALSHRERGTETIRSTQRLVEALRTQQPEASRDALAQHLAVVEIRTLQALRRLQPEPESEPT